MSFQARAGQKKADLLAGVLANGANAIQSTRFTPTDEEIAAARRKLSEDATKTSIAQADAIAQAAGMKVVAIRNVNVDKSADLAKVETHFDTSGQLYLDGFTGGQLPLAVPGRRRPIRARQRVKINSPWTVNINGRGGGRAAFRHSSAGLSTWDW